MAIRSPASWLCFAIVLVGLCRTAGADDFGEPETLRREGFMIGVALGPGVYRGGGELKGAKGQGPMISLRFGTVATETVEWFAELDGGVFSREVGLDLENHHNLLVVGAQWYARDVFWLRGALGGATFEVSDSGSTAAVAGSTRKGGAYLFGVGYDLVQRGRFALGLELSTSGGVYGDAIMAHSGVQLAAVWY